MCHVNLSPLKALAAKEEKNFSF